MAISAFEIYFFIAVFTLGFLPALARLAADDVRQSAWHCVGVSALSGFLAFAIVAATFGDPADDTYKHWLALGVAAALGSAGTQQDRILKTVLKRLGLLEDDKPTENK